MLPELCTSPVISAGRRTGTYCGARPSMGLPGCSSKSRNCHSTWLSSGQIALQIEQRLDPKVRPWIYHDDVQPQVASRFGRTDLRVTRMTAVAGLVLLLLLLGLLALSYEPLQFTQFSGMTPPLLSVVNGPQGTVTYQVTLHNQGIIPVQVTGVEGVPGQPLAPAAVQVMPDEGDAATQPFRPFILPPFESV